MSVDSNYQNELSEISCTDREFSGTYHLAFRDLPLLLGRAKPGARALDFGCGTGHSTRLLASLGFDTEGIDSSEALLTKARSHDPQSRYYCLPEGDLSLIADARYDRILCAFIFDNIPIDRKGELLNHLSRLLKPGGLLLNLVSAEARYWMEWTSFSTFPFPKNSIAQPGDPVFTLLKDSDNARPVQDIYCPESVYIDVYREVGLDRTITHRPLGRREETSKWINELQIAPWRIDILQHPPKRFQPLIERIFGLYRCPRHGACKYLRVPSQ